MSKNIGQKNLSIATICCDLAIVTRGKEIILVVNRRFLIAVLGANETL